MPGGKLVRTDKHLGTSLPDRTRMPLLFCFCGPGASGKSTVCRALLDDASLCLSISTTTRPPRPNEADGVDYHFVTPLEFDRRIQSGNFLEHAEFNGNRYGTEMRNLTECEEAGCDLLLDIDMQGAEALRNAIGSRVVVVLVFPPSGADLVDRFRTRGTDSPERVRSRLSIARREVARLRDPLLTDYLLINDTVDAAVARARAFIIAERHRLTRFTPEYLDRLLVVPDL